MLSYIQCQFLQKSNYLIRSRWPNLWLVVYEGAGIEWNKVLNRSETTLNHLMKNRLLSIKAEWSSERQMSGVECWVSLRWQRETRHRVAWIHPNRWKTQRFTSQSCDLFRQTRRRERGRKTRLVFSGGVHRGELSKSLSARKKTNSR